MECRFYHLVKSCIKASDYAKCGPINRLFFFPSRPQVFFKVKASSVHSIFQKKDLNPCDLVLCRSPLRAQEADIFVSVQDID